MAHFVTVSDPWYGQFILAGRNDWDWYTHQSLVMGPLFLYRFRSESITNQGNRARRLSMTEKPCQHSYVEGSITGTVKWTPPEGCVYCSLGDGVYQWVAFEDPFLIVRCTCTTSVIIDVDVVTVSVDFLEEFIDPSISPNPITSQCWGGVLRGVVDTDPRTGTVSYECFEEISRHAEDDLGRPLSIDFYLGVGNAPFSEGSSSFANSIPALFDFCQAEMGKVRSTKPDKTSRDEAIYAAIDDLSLSNVNWPEQIKDIKEFLDTVRSFIDLFRPIKGILDLIKRFANFWLFWKYVVLTTAMDVEDLRRLVKLLKSNLGNLGNLIRRSDMIGRGTSLVQTSVGGVDTTVRHNAKVRYGPDTSALDGLLSRLSLLHFVPRLSDLWDLVPYSFVIDWVIPVSDALDNFENKVNQQTLPLIYLVLSRKVTRHITRSWALPGHTFSVDLSFVTYDRAVHRDLPSDMWLGLRLQDPRKQWITATALIVQRSVK